MLAAYVPWVDTTMTAYRDRVIPCIDFVLTLRLVRMSRKRADAECRKASHDVHLPSR